MKRSTTSAGDYLVEVQARDGSSGTWQADTMCPYTPSGASGACTAVTLSPSGLAASPRNDGDLDRERRLLQLAGVPLLRVHGTNWTIIQDWGTSPTFSWNTTGLAPGSYIVKAEACAGTSGTWQAYIDVPYTLQ